MNTAGSRGKPPRPPRAAWSRKRAVAGPPVSITGGRICECESCLAFFRGYSGERRHQLVHIVTVAIRTPDLSLLDVGGVVLLREFLTAVLTVKGVLGHRQTPSRHHSSGGCECGVICRKTSDSQQSALS